jgi:hypothetical protein
VFDIRNHPTRSYGSGTMRALACEPAGVASPFLTPGDIISERRAASSRNGGWLRPEFLKALTRAISIVVHLHRSSANIVDAIMPACGRY